jgi:chorismate mutase
MSHGKAAKHPSRLSPGAFLLFLLLAACAALPADTSSIDRLLGLMHERLRLADDVARNKWNRGAPIEDAVRENAIVEEVGAGASRYGITPDLARQFFRAQIEASKVIQRARFAEWSTARQPKFERVADLQADIRPALDALTPQLLTALGAALPLLAESGVRSRLQARSAALMGTIDAPARATAIEPLLKIRPAPGAGR